MKRSKARNKVHLEFKYNLAQLDIGDCFQMGSVSVSLPSKWEEFFKRLADEHEIEVSKVISELSEWAFSNSESKTQFEVWLDKAYPPKGEAEDAARAEGEEANEAEEEIEDEAEEELHEDRDYSEDREPKP